VQLEFADRRGLEASHAQMKKRFGMAVVPGENDVMKKLRAELAEYFAGARRNFRSRLNYAERNFRRRFGFN
jgi:O6-methylguanine-DNA--protein-cysteine methyltransferase